MAAVASDLERADAALKKLLDEINSTLGDFSECPAMSATDVASSGDSPLHKVAIWGDVAAAEVLLRNGANINALGEDDDTPLHRAIAGGHVEMVRYLLAHGANADLANRYDNTPSKDAESSGDPSLVAAFRWQSKEPP